MADLARLGILVDSRSAATATGRLNALTASAGRAEASTLGLSNRAKRLAFTLGAAGLAGAATALGVAFTKSISIGREYTSTLSELEAITGISGQALEDLSEQSLETSADTGRAASEIVEAYKLVASQLAELIDFDTQAGQRVLQSVAEDAVTLSQAAGIDLKTAVQATTTAINQFNLSADQANMVVNNLAAGSKFGAAEVASIQEALTEAGSAAATAGEDLNTTNAAIQVLAANAIKGSRAGTGLKNVFLRLLTQSDQLAKHGIKDVNLESEGLVATLRRLEPIVDDAAALQQIFGMEAFAAARILIDQADSLESLEGKMADTNTATEQAAIQMDNLDGDIAKLSETINKDLIESFQNGESSFREVVQELTVIWEEFGDDFIGVLDFIVSGTASKLKGWKQIWKDEFDDTINWTEDNVFTMLSKLDAKITQLALGSVRGIASFGGEFADFLADAFVRDPISVIEMLFPSIATERAAKEEARKAWSGFQEELARFAPVEKPVDDIVEIDLEQLGTKIQAFEEKFRRDAERLFEDQPILIRAGIRPARFMDEDLIDDIERQFQQFDRMGELFDGFDSGAAKAKLLRSDIEHFIRSGEGNEAVISRLMMLYRQWTGESIERVGGLTEGTDDLTDSASKSNQSARDLGFTFSSAFEDAAINVRDLNDLLGVTQGLLEDVMRIFLRTTVTQPLGEGLAGLLSGVDLFGGSEAVNDLIITDQGRVFKPSPDDTIMAMKDFSPIVNATAKAAPANVQVNVVNNSNSQVDAQESRTPGGGVQIDMLVKDAFEGLANSGRLDRTMNRNFGVSRKGQRRG